MGLKQPEFKQDSGFKVTLFRNSYEEQSTDPLTHQPTMQETVQVTMQETVQVTMQVKKLLSILSNEKSMAEILEILKLNNRDYVRLNYIHPSLEQELIELKYPDNPKHRSQKYRLTQKGKSVLESFS